MSTYSKTYSKTLVASWNKGTNRRDNGPPLPSNVIAYYRVNDFDSPLWVSYIPTSSTITQQIKGSGFHGAGTGSATGLLTTDSITAGGGTAPTCSVNGTLTISADCWDVYVHRAGVLWSYWPGINVGATFEIDASGEGHHLYLTTTTITERLDGTGTNWANEMGFTVANGTQHLDDTGETPIGAGWRIPTLVDGSGAAAYSYNPEVVHYSSGAGVIVSDWAGSNDGAIINGIVDLSRLTYTSLTDTALVEATADSVELISTAATANARLVSSNITVEPGEIYTIDVTVDNIYDGSSLYFRISDSIGILTTRTCVQDTPNRGTFTARNTAVYFTFYATSTAVIGHALVYDIRLLKGNSPIVNRDEFNPYNSITWNPVNTEIDDVFLSTSIPYSSDDVIQVSDLLLNYGDKIFLDCAYKKALLLDTENNTLARELLGGTAPYFTLSETVDHYSITAQNATSILEISNPYSDYGNIHPKLLYFPDGWNGYAYWMCYSPYPDAVKENPCIAVSNDLSTWTVPTGVVNPLDPPPTSPAYNSDPMLLYREDTDTMELWWREYESGVPNVFYRRTSTDGVTWSAAESVYTTPVGSAYVSPAVVYEDELYKMWVVQPESVYIWYLESADLITWSTKVHAPIDLPNLSLLPWHIEVIKTDIGYEFLIQAFDSAGSYQYSDMYHCIMKPDGTYTIPTLVLQRSTDPDAQDYSSIYKATFVKTGSNYTIIYTGQNYTGDTASGLQRALMLTSGTLTLS